MAKGKSLPIVEISFYDHFTSEDMSEEVMPCRIYGVLIYEDEISYHVAYWITEADFEQCEKVVIVKHDGVKVRKLCHYGSSL